MVGFLMVTSMVNCVAKYFPTIYRSYGLGSPNLPHLTYKKDHRIDGSMVMVSTLDPIESIESLVDLPR